MFFSSPPIIRMHHLMGLPVARVSRTQVGELAVVDGGDASSFTGAVASFPAAVARVLDETGHAIGVDMDQLMGRRRAQGGAK